MKNLNVSILLDKPDLVFIHFHEFTHNAPQISNEVYNKHNIPTIFIVSLDSFKDVIDEIKTPNTLGCLTTPIDKKELINILP